MDFFIFPILLLFVLVKPQHPILSFSPPKVGRRLAGLERMVGGDHFHDGRRRNVPGNAQKEVCEECAWQGVLVKSR
jgi:hypothetical protein